MAGRQQNDDGVSPSVMGPDLDLTTLRLLVAVDERGSLNAGAAALGIGQPAASARIRAFEARWRLTVLHRSARGSSLTTDGQAVVTWARTTLQSVDTMRAAVAALSADRSAGISIAASLTVAEFMLPAWLGELHARRPDLQPTLRVVNSSAVADLVRTQAVDVGFIEIDDRPDGLVTRVIGRDRVVAVVAPTHPWARRTSPVDRAELIIEHWVVRERGSGTRGTFERAVEQSVIPALEVSSTTALVGAALAGVGPAVVAERAVARELESGRLVRVSTELELSRPLAAVWHPERRLSEPVIDLLALAERDRS